MVCARRAPPFQGCASPSNDIRDPRVAKARPWAEIGEHLRCKPAFLSTMPHSDIDRISKREHRVGAVANLKTVIRVTTAFDLYCIGLSISRGNTTQHLTIRNQ